jgi:radical SAM protein with 4Fe4S-binding SPASM domain
MLEVTPSARLNALTLARNIPVSVTAELTRRCPLGCRHCYLPETRGRARPGGELTAAQWKDILLQLAQAGALYLAFTGGEPLLRPDLAELCAYAKELNFDVRVFSTGLGLDRALALRLKKAGVSGFEISFYGRSVFHDGITGVKGSFARSLAAARLLKKAGIKVKMKTPLMKRNLAQAGWLRTLARREGFKISFDPVLTAANDGDAQALKLRLSAGQVAEAVKLLGAPRAAPAATSSLDFLCGAGRNVCSVGPAGELFPCLQLPVQLGSLAREKFAVIWKNGLWLKKWRGAGAKDVKDCLGCDSAAYCSRCPGVSLVEEGSAFAANKSACAMARANRKAAAA